MNKILFFDLEVGEKNEKIEDVGAILREETFHSSSLKVFEYFSKEASFICGHNILAHDLKYLKKARFNHDFLKKPAIDTLYLSALLFSEKPYHRLVKDYRLNRDHINNPLADSKLVKTLFYDLVEKFKEIAKVQGRIYYILLKDTPEFKGFFSFLEKEKLVLPEPPKDIISLISSEYSEKICVNASLEELIKENPLELSYALSLISTADLDSINPPWIIKNFPAIKKVIHKLRLIKCNRENCNYCNSKLDLKKSLYRFFGYKNFRKFDYDDDVPLQEKVVRAALNNKSLLAIFPTGGGKSLAFQLPALMIGEGNRSLTVVISPLQSLMKDQVDVLKKRFDITRAVTINGLLSPLERSEAIERVAEGGANLLYISPESLRSRTILTLLTNRDIARFVIDEAHCFSSWGHDFRVDYLYIGEFLKLLMEEKNITEPIPVSCFTATAKVSVIEDITTYFKEKLGITLELFQTHAKRENLTFNVFETKNEETKYDRLKNLLLEQDGPKIIYVSRVKTTEKLAELLKREGFSARPYNGQMESDVKIEVQNEFMEGKTEIIVATSAFGMGVDKDNVSMVIHYEISDSLENYVQEAGRAGRKEDLEASCYILFDEKDLNKHFTLLNATKLNQKEIGQIWRGIKKFKKEKFTKSALEIARSSGWDSEMKDLETKVKTAISVLEDCGYVKRGQNSPRIFANSFLVRDVVNANKKIDETDKLNEQEKITAKRIFQHLVSHNDTRVDYMIDILGVTAPHAVKVLNILKEIGLIGDTKDLTASINTGRGKKNSKNILSFYKKLEMEFIKLLKYSKSNKIRRVYLKEINEELIEKGLADSNIEALRNIIRYWSVKDLIKLRRSASQRYAYEIKFKPDYNDLVKIFKKRIILSEKVLDYLYTVQEKQYSGFEDREKKDLIRFSLMEIKENVESDMFLSKNSLLVYEKILLYLKEIGSVKLEGGLVVAYIPYTITRLEKNNLKQFTKENYEKLKTFYENKVEQIHIVGEYAKKILKSYSEAMEFVDNYFRMEYKKFINKYFPDRKTEIKRPLTDEKFKEIFGMLSTGQLEIIKDNQNKHILVAAGPGSGKTRILVHKIASLLLMEDIKPEQFLMLTFSRPASIELKNRLFKLVGSVAYYIDIFTYHSYGFNLLGRLGSLEKSETIIKQATEAIINGDVPPDKIDIKSVLVVDEFQDIGQEEFDFLNAIIKKAEDIRVIVVGDDDQNIYEFRGSSVKYMREFREKYNAPSYFLDINFRSKANIVGFSNQFLKFLKDRIKKEAPIRPITEENGIIQIIKYKTKNLIIPLVKHIASLELKGTTAVLTVTNEEAMLVETVLKQKNIPARLILSNEGFRLKNLIELRVFSHYISQNVSDELGFISDEIWSKAKEAVKKGCGRSSNLALTMKIIGEFERESKKRFKSDWKDYLEEIKIEEFYSPDKEVILVSTMHKAKGKEFDNVFIMLDDYGLYSDEKKRVLYVAITRAKENLFIHTNKEYFDGFKVENLDFTYDKMNYNEPENFVVQLSLDNINLSHHKRNSLVNLRKMQPGDRLKEVAAGVLRDYNNLISLRFAKKFNERHGRFLEKGYRVQAIKAGYVVLWNDREDNSNNRIILPKILYTRR